MIVHLLDNASIAALIGAAAAYFLVAATDWRRRRREAQKQLPALLRRLLVLVDTRHKGAIGSRDSVSSDPRVRPIGNIGLRFPVERIERYLEQVGDSLTDRQAFALDNICFAMREADHLNAASRDLTLEMDRARLDATRGEGNQLLHVHGLSSLLQKQYGEEGALLNHARELIKAYLEERLNERGGVLNPAPTPTPESQKSA